MKHLFLVFSIPLLLVFGFGCAAKKQEMQADTGSCESYKSYASVTFEVEGNLSELVEKTAKKALARSCFKKSDQSTANMRIQIKSEETKLKESGFIKNKYDNTFRINIVAIMLIPTQQGGLTTLTSNQHASLNMKAEPIADIGSKAELSEKELIPFIEENVSVALVNLWKEMP